MVVTPEQSETVASSLAENTNDKVDITIEKYTHTSGDGNEFSVVYPSLSGLSADQSDKVNATLKSAFTEWVADDCQWVESGQFSIVSINNCFITVSETFPDQYPKAGYLRLFCTVDITDGKRVALKDIISMNSEFEDFVASQVSDTGKSIWATYEDVKEILTEASMTEKDYLDAKRNGENIPFEDAATWGILRYKGGFYLTDDALVIIHDGAINKDVYLNFKAIESFQEQHEDGSGSLSASP